MNDLVPKAGDFIVQQRGGKEIRKFRKIRLIGKVDSLLTREVSQKCTSAMILRLIKRLL